MEEPEKKEDLKKYKLKKHRDLRQNTPKCQKSNELSRSKYLNFLKKQNDEKQNTVPTPAVTKRQKTQEGSLQLPKLKYCLNKKKEEGKRLSKMSQSYLDKSSLTKSQEVSQNLAFSASALLAPFSSSHNPQNAQKSQRISILSKSNKHDFIQRLTEICEMGTKLQKSTNGILNKAMQAEKNIGKRYHRLSQNSSSILTGIQSYLLEEQQNRNYKYEIRQMWMKYDK